LILSDEVLVQAFGERDDRVLRHAVDGHAGRGEQAGDRRRVHDVALVALREHHGDEAAQAVDDAVDVHAHAPFPVGGGALPREAAGGDAGVVAEDVHGAERGEGRVLQGFHLVGLRDIHLHADHGGACRAELVGGAVEGVLLDVREHDLHALACESARHGEPESAGASGDHRDLAGKVLHGMSSSVGSGGV